MLYRWRLTVIEPQFLGGTIAWPGAAASSAATAPRTTAGTRGVNRRREIIASHNARGTRTLRSGCVTDCHLIRDTAGEDRVMGRHRRGRQGAARQPAQLPP